MRELSVSDTVESKSDFGRGLRALRQRRRLSLEALASKSGLTKGHLYKLETGTSDPGLSTLRFLTAALGYDVVLLAFGPPPPGRVESALVASLCVEAFCASQEVARKAIQDYFGVGGAQEAPPTLT